MMYDTKDFTKVIPGDIAFGLTHGPGRWTIPAGQLLIGDQNQWEHVALAVGDNLLAEAMPPRARIREAPQDMLYYRLPLSAEQRDYCAEVPVRELQLGVVKYSWLAFLNMGLLKWHIRPNWVRDAVEKSPRRICSQFVDDYLTHAGFHVLEGVLPGEVSPGDLAFRFGNDPSCRPFRIDGREPWTRPIRGKI